MIGSLFAIAGASLTVPGTIELALVTLGAYLPRASHKGPGHKGPRQRLRKIAVVIPAHNEEGGIAACLDSLKACEPCEEATVELVVIADNCTDDTAGAARAAGARVLERHDEHDRGKGFALEYGFRSVLADPEVDAVMVVDADTEVEASFLRAAEAAFAEGAQAVQSRYQIGNPDASDRVRLVAIAFKAFNVLRPMGRSRLGLSAGILGNGFGLTRGTVERIPYTAHSVVEDLEYHLRLVREGVRVEFLEDTEVRADQPVGDQGTETQRARWEGGRLRMMREHLPRLAKEVFLRRDLRMVEPLLELSALPLALHVGALGGLLLIPFPPTQLYALGGLGVVAMHVGTALSVAGFDPEDVRALARTPKYIAWKLGVLPKVLEAARASQSWVRTDREREPAQPVPAAADPAPN